MPRLTSEFGLNLWRAAAKAELGIKIRIDPKEIDRIRTELYKIRKAANESVLNEVILCLVPSGDEIFFVRKTVEVI